jgi:hypothetical protein
VDVLEMWIVVGVPGLVLAAALFVGRSRVRAYLGYVVLVAVVGAFALTPGGVWSAAAVGVLTVGLVAAGRGTALDDRYAEHHQVRGRYTTAGDDDPV